MSMSPVASSSVTTPPTSAPSASPSARFHLARLEALFVEILKLCALAGLAKIGTIALDGTKVKANASRHKAMSYERMKTEESRLKGEIAKLLADAEATDKAEDSEHGPDHQGDELPDELARRQSRLAVIQRARKLLEERARIEATEQAARRQAEGKSPPTTPPSESVPDPKDQINFTDPESRIMKASNKGWDQVRTTLSSGEPNEHQIILAADVTPQANDVRQTVPTRFFNWVRPRNDVGFMRPQGTRSDRSSPRIAPNARSCTSSIAG